MCRTLICSGTCMLTPPVDAHRVLVLAEAYVEIAVVGALKCFPDAARGMHVARRNDRVRGRLGDVHDSMQRMFGALVRGRVAGELQQLCAVGIEEFAGERHDAGRELIVGAGTGGTRHLVRLRWRLAPLPAPIVE